jgi:ankyrin repeat protein
MQGDASIAQLLIQHHADENAADKKGCSALYDAARFGFDSIACSLFERKADVDATTQGGEIAIMP